MRMDLTSAMVSECATLTRVYGLGKGGPKDELWLMYVIVVAFNPCKEGRSGATRTQMMLLGHSPGLPRHEGCQFNWNEAIEDCERWDHPPILCTQRRRRKSTGPLREDVPINSTNHLPMLP